MKKQKNTSKQDNRELDAVIDFSIPYENVYLFDSETEFRII